MVLDLLYSTLKRESEPINTALRDALQKLPDTVKPVAAHIFNAGGKRLRPFLTVSCARMLGVLDSSVYPLGASLELLHSATLLHDDILDDADTRRGQSTAHNIFGTRETILAGDALLALGNAIVADYNIPALSACYSTATMQTAAGEILEIANLHSPELSPEKYIEIARGKTACLISQACIMGATLANAAQPSIKACGAYGDNLGLAFQLVDDALDFAPTGQTGKPAGGDLREGKMTPPIRLYRASLAEADRVEFDRLFITGNFTDAQMSEFVNAIRPFAEESLNLADECLAEAIEALSRLPAGETRDVLAELARHVRDRKN